jgi:hypothetical protein
VINVLRKLEKRVLLHRQEVADLLEVTPATINNWVNADQFPGPIVGRQYSAFQIIEFLKGDFKKDKSNG